MKFPDEALFPEGFSQLDKENLERVFSTSDPQSQWRRALTMIGIEHDDRPDAVIRWLGEKPYFNWSHMISVVGNGAIVIGKNPDSAPEFFMTHRPRPLWRFITRQWKIAKFSHKAHENDDQVSLSLALGIVLQSLTLRLGSDAAKLAAWLASPADAPSRHKKTLEQIQRTQMKRTELSGAWKNIFSNTGNNSSGAFTYPDYFWDDDIPEITKRDIELPVKQDEWKGLPVHPGNRAGLAVAITRESSIEKILALKNDKNIPLILVFRQARPETTEFFGLAAALVFCEGGALSHACTVARDMGIPAVTGVGRSLHEFVLDNPQTWIEIDGTLATVRLTQR